MRASKKRTVMIDISCSWDVSDLGNAPKLAGGVEREGKVSERSRKVAERTTKCNELRSS